MQKTKRIVSGTYKAALFLAGLYAITVQSGLWEGSFNPLIFRYYTLLSNVLCCLYFGVASAFAFMGKETLLPRVKGTMIMGITVTGLVYHFMLSNSTFSMGGSMATANIILHYIVPVCSVLDWLLFDQKGHYTKLSPFIWTIFPNLYFVAATIYGFSGGQPFYDGGRFPYFFINYDTQGVGKVLLYVLALNAMFVLLGYVYYAIDRLLARKAENSAKA